MNHMVNHREQTTKEQDNKEQDNALTHVKSTTLSPA